MSSWTLYMKFSKSKASTSYPWSSWRMSFMLMFINKYWKTWPLLTSKDYIYIRQDIPFPLFPCARISFKLLTFLIQSIQRSCLFQPIWLWSFIMRTLLTTRNAWLTRCKNSWRMPWSKCGRTIILHFASTFLYVIFWIWINVGNICSLWYKFQTQYVHKFFASVYLLFHEPWTKIDLMLWRVVSWCTML
jgi:hypothetical protein